MKTNRQLLEAAAKASPLDIPVRGWMPIETAPKDGSRVLLFFAVFGTGPHQEFGKWEVQKHHKKPNPYWSGDRERIYGTLWYRNNPPTHWMPQAEAPNAELSRASTDLNETAGVDASA